MIMMYQNLKILTRRMINTILIVNSEIKELMIEKFDL